ncbi:MAG: family 10 glycosylhydrolase, partial [Lacrimispora sp.]
MAWWLRNNLRMIQNNIRDIDANMDVDTYITTLKDFGANVLQIGCGGISSFFPTKLPYQTPSPYLKGDFIGEVVEKAHKNDIKVITRFDFSKTHVRMLEDHPDWYYRKADGSPLLYHDTAATCVNGQYQQEYSLEIIREVIEKYPVDGIFFNMFGYLTRDYSGNYSGICQCDNCKRRFREMFGETLPLAEDEDDPVFRKYQKFKEITVGEILEKIRRTTKSVSEDIAVSTYSDQFVDIVRNESNSALDRALPFWIYESADNVGLIEGGFDDKISSNCAINAVDLPYRFMGVSKYLNQIRLYGDMAAGSGLDWCIIGSFEDYPDRENFESTKEIFHFHRRHEKYYGHFDPMQKILLVFDGEFRGVNKEYRGIFRAFKEDHILFRTMQTSALEGFAKCTAEMGNPFDGFDFVILPGVRELSPAILAYLKSTTRREPGRRQRRGDHRRPHL